jgi:peptidase E
MNVGRFLVSQLLNSIVGSQMIILQGGEDVRKRTNEALFRSIAAISTTKRILIIPWTQESDDREMEYLHLFRGYFSDCGFQSTDFLNKGDNDSQVSEKFVSTDVIYLPGGDPGILYRALNSKSLQDKLRVFKGTIIGNSAGAIVLSRGGIGDRKFYPGFGLVGFFIKVHFKLEKEMLFGNEKSETISIPENMWIAVSEKS